MIKLLISFLLCFNFLTALENNLYSTPYLTKDLNALCVPVKNSKGNAFVKLHVEQFTIPFEAASEDIKIPTLIIHLTDIFNFSNVPMMGRFSSLSHSQKARLIKDDKFDLKAKGPVNHDEYLNDYLTLKEGNNHYLTLDVKKSGFYCIYVSPPEDFHDFKIPIIYHNSYGYLNYIEHVMYSQSIWGVLLLIIISVILFRNLINSVGKNFENLDNVSVISKVSVFYVLLPSIGIAILVIVNDAILNHMENRPWFFVMTRKAISYTLLVGSSICNYMILLLCMGYGVLYYHRKTKSYRELPKSSLRYANILLIVDLTVMALIICNKTVFNTSTSLLAGLDMIDEYQTSTGQIVEFGLNFVLGVTKLVIYCSSIYYGYHTNKIIKEFPPYGTNTENYAEKNQNISKTFKRSLYIIFLVPIYSVFAVTLIIMYSSVSDMMKEFPIDTQVTQEQITYIAQDLVIEHGIYLFYQIWDIYFVGIFVIISLYYLWVKNNEGLVIDKEEQDGYTDYFDEEPPVVV